MAYGSHFPVEEISEISSLLISIDQHHRLQFVFPHRLLPLLDLQIKDPFIRRFRENGVEGLTGYRGLCQYAEITEDQGLLWKIAVVEKYGEQIPDLLERIHGRHQTRQQKHFFQYSI